MQPDIKLIECPRDAMQGMADFIPTQKKAEYLNLLLKVGFDTLDFGSFVSAKAIPQLTDTVDVIRKLDVGQSATKLLAIVANTRGAQEAAGFEEIAYLGFPFSVSETFQQRNTNAGIEEALVRVAEMMDICAQKGKELVVYLSMGFGNPYGDAYDVDILKHWTQELVKMNVGIISLADTIGVSTVKQIESLYPALCDEFGMVQWGMHLHSKPADVAGKIAAAFEVGCRRFDSAIKGFGGCPMAKDELTGNIPTEVVLEYLEQRNIPMKLNKEAFLAAKNYADSLFIK